MEWRIGGLLYADDIAVITNSAEGMERVLEDVMVTLEEYGMKLSEEKSKIVEVGCRQDDQEERQRWTVRGKTIMRHTETKYLGVMLGEGGICQFSESLKRVGNLTGMIKYAAKRSGSRFVVGREGWKSLVVGRFMYGVAAVGWTAVERNKAEALQKKFGRSMWRVETSVRSSVVHGETAWSSFWEREAKLRADFVSRTLEREDIVSRVGRACGEELGVKSKWWRGVVSLGRKLGLEVMMRMVWRRKFTQEGLRAVGHSRREIEDMRKSELTRRIQKVAREEWKEKLQGNGRLERYAEEKGEDRRKERYVNGSDGAKVRMMCRGDSLTVRGNQILRWKYDTEEERRCVCGEEETEKHVLLECRFGENVREEWLGAWRREKGDLDAMEGVLGYAESSQELEGLTMRCIGAIWREREKREKLRGVE